MLKACFPGVLPSVGRAVCGQCLMECRSWRGWDLGSAGAGDKDLSLRETETGLGSRGERSQRGKITGELRDHQHKVCAHNF